MQKKSSTSAGPATLGLLGLAGGLAGIFRFLGRQPELKSRSPDFIALTLAAGAFYLVGVYLVESVPLGPTTLLVILGGAAAFRLCVLPLAPPLSDDVYRYQWEGRVQRTHFNPYTVFPETPGLRRLQDPEHPLETGRTTPTVYPPFSEKAFSWVETVPAYKRLATALDFASVGVLLLLLAVLKQPPHRVLTYAWNPTVVVSFAMCGHHDSLAILTLLTANLLIIAHRRALSIAFLALAFLAKYFPVLLLPVFLKWLKRKRWAYAGIFGVVVTLGYLPYIDAGGNLFRGLWDFAGGWEANDSLFRLIRHASTSKAQAELVAGVIVLGMVAYALKYRMEPLRASLFITAGLVLLSPNAFPWYFTWSIPFLCFYPSVPWLLMSITAVLGYAPVIPYAAGQPYQDSPFVLALEYVPVFLWLGYEGWRTLQRGSGLVSRGSGLRA